MTEKSLRIVCSSTFLTIQIGKKDSLPGPSRHRVGFHLAISQERQEKAVLTSGNIRRIDDENVVSASYHALLDI